MKKYKYLIFNEENKILFLCSTNSNEYLHIYIPLYNEKETINSVKILKILSKTDAEAVELNIYKENEKYFEHQNNKLIPKIKEKEKCFLGIYHEFSKEDIEKVTIYCHDHNLEPWFLSTEEIISLIENKDNKLKIDKGIKEAVKVLTKKINYQEY